MAAELDARLYGLRRFRQRPRSSVGVLVGAVLIEALVFLAIGSGLSSNPAVIASFVLFGVVLGCAIYAAFYSVLPGRRARYAILRDRLTAAGAGEYEAVPPLGRADTRGRRLEFRTGLAVVGLLIAMPTGVISVVNAHSADRWVSSATRTPAEVTEYVNGHGSEASRLEVAYLVKGRRFTGWIDLHLSSTTYHRGQTVMALYHPEDPGKVQLAALPYNLAGPLGFAIVVLVCCIAPLVAAMWRFRRQANRILSSDLTDIAVRVYLCRWHRWWAVLYAQNADPGDLPLLAVRVVPHEHQSWRWMASGSVRGRKFPRGLVPVRADGELFWARRRAKSGKWRHRRSPWGAVAETQPRARLGPAVGRLLLGDVADVCKARVSEGQLTMSCKQVAPARRPLYGAPDPASDPQRAGSPLWRVRLYAPNGRRIFERRFDDHDQMDAVVQRVRALPPSARVTDALALLGCE